MTNDTKFIEAIQSGKLAIVKHLWEDEPGGEPVTVDIDTAIELAREVNEQRVLQYLEQQV